jgi:tetratricopeptide (TPR) repeat protein
MTGFPTGHGWRRRAWAWIAVVAVLAAAGTGAQEPSTFDAAASAFERGDYSGALELFERARAEGVDTPALHYNIGVSQYRTEDYAGAEATFRSIGERFPRLAPLASYNRGLALLALERTEEARAAFEDARSHGDERLALLAAEALNRMGAASVIAGAAPRWIGYFDFGLGHDDNVALVDELTLPATASASSAYGELLGYASRELASLPLRFTVSGYSVRYVDASEFDQDSLRADAAFEWTAGPWRVLAGPHLAHTTLDGDGFERALGATLRAERTISERLWFDVRFVLDDISAPSARFDFVEGQRRRLRLGMEGLTAASARMRLYYELDWQDRDDPSVSPERSRIAFTYARRVSETWSLDGGVSYRSSTYGDLLIPRDERLKEITAGARRELASGWLLTTEYRWADNDSDVARYSYRSNRIGLAFSRSF